MERQRRERVEKEVKKDFIDILHMCTLKSMTASVTQTTAKKWGALLDNPYEPINFTMQHLSCDKWLI